MPQGCEIIRPAAQALLEKRGFTVVADKCVDCLLLQSKHLQTPNGHRVLLTETAIERYMDTSGDGKLPPGSWIAHSPLKTAGEMRLQQISGQCNVQLLFRYSWYAGQFLIIFPVDGDPASRPSNLRLEREYLAAIAAHTGASQGSLH